MINVCSVIFYSPTSYIKEKKLFFTLVFSHRCNPFHILRFSMQLQSMELTFSRTEVGNFSGLIDKNHSRSWRNFLCTKRTFCHYRFPLLSFLASISVSLNIKMSFNRTGPFTFLERILFASLPSRIFHRTWMFSPRVPVLQIISSTRAGPRGKINQVRCKILEGRD